MALISIKNLSVTYFMGKSNEVRALKDVSLEIEAGEFIIFFGASGCGKSTLLYTIAGLEKPTGGEVMVGDINLSTMTNAQLEAYRQRTIGMVFQAFYLIPSLSVLRNVMLPQIAIGVDPETRKKEAERLVQYFGVYEQRHKLPNELSGGQQQRIAISRALINDPDIIFADEPVGNLDSKSAQDVLGLIQELSIKEKKTVILVTHDPSHLDIADRVFFMKDGQVIDVKKNTQTRNITKHAQEEAAKAKETAAAGDGMGTEPGKSTLEHVAETFSKPGFMGEMLLEYKAKQIVADTLTSFTIEELEAIEAHVKHILKHTAKDTTALETFLDGGYKAGGLHLNKRTAVKLAKRIWAMAEDMTLMGEVAAHKDGKRDAYIDRLRAHLLETFEVTVHSTDVIDVIDGLIADRMNGVTDKKGVQAQLDLAVSKGGAGLDTRTARKLARMLELIMLGRYAVPEASEPASKKQRRSRKQH